ncbi:MAG: serine protease [Thermoplasmatota archaeon]
MTKPFLLLFLLVAASASGCIELPGTGGDDNGDGGDAAGTGDELVPADGAPGDDEGPRAVDPSFNGTDGGAPGPAENVTSVGNWTWPDLGAASIRPGVQVVAAGAQCTSNFVFHDPLNTTLYIGVAAHCVADGAQDNVDGCDRSNRPLELGLKGDVDGASGKATLVYSSWETMQRVNETNAAACRYNDFALFELDAGDLGKAHPAMLTFGGPTGMAGSVGLGSKVLTYGNTNLRPGPAALDAREGYVIETGGSGWTHTVYTALPGVPGDSGSAVTTGDGKALGVLSTVTLYPLAASNGISDLGKILAYARDVGGFDARLATWEQLDDGLLP